VYSRGVREFRPDPPLSFYRRLRFRPTGFPRGTFSGCLGLLYMPPRSLNFKWTFFPVFFPCGVFYFFFFGTICSPCPVTRFAMPFSRLVFFPPHRIVGCPPLPTQSGCPQEVPSARLFFQCDCLFLIILRFISLRVQTPERSPLGLHIILSSFPRALIPRLCFLLCVLFN